MNLNEKINQHFSAIKNRVINSDLVEFLKIKSVSADPAYVSECERAADWLARYLSKLGFQTEIFQTTSKPLVLANLAGSIDHTFVYYGHYDVQPADPENLWQSPPFEPTIKEGRIYARGACDNKGMTLSFFAGVESLIRSGLPYPNIKVILEGEEESGGSGINNALPSLINRLKGDTLIVYDTSTPEKGRGTITMGLRGILGFEINLNGPAYDLHSGGFGGAVANPALFVAKIAASFHNEDGTVAVSGFYDDVAEPSPQEIKLAEKFAPDEQTIKRAIAVNELWGEKSYSPIARISFRPTLEINGITSGYGGEGGKTIIPAKANIKITCRLVPNQDPAKILESIKKHIEKLPLPKGISCHLTSAHGATGKNYLRAKSDTLEVKLARQIFEELTSKETAFEWSGGSIPILAEICDRANLSPLLVGLSLEADRIHAPNESFDLEQFELGAIFAARFLTEAKQLKAR
ncbi:MAG TPA: M20/M25/M40 family metallo-hydrolase [Oligoflexia bacterium]|nr:M20/M25/M40 family metallo-hydrolase [Oligoflexia bacterium]HMP27176.1 M20/M25/M40 family metallo-hydrolase [Oligoflexia bacterium]